MDMRSIMGDWLVVATIFSTSPIIASGYLVHCARIYMQMIEILDLVWILPILLCTTLIFEFGEGVIVPDIRGNTDPE